MERCHQGPKHHSGSFNLLVQVVINQAAGSSRSTHSVTTFSSFFPINLVIFSLTTSHSLEAVQVV